MRTTMMMKKGGSELEARTNVRVACGCAGCMQIASSIRLQFVSSVACRTGLEWLV